MRAPPPRPPRRRRCLLPTLVLPLLAAVPAPGATIIVPDDHPRIQAAIAASSPGDSVLVRSGTYVEHLWISHDLTLIGAPESALPVIDGDFDPDSSAVEILAPARVHIARFRITRGSGPGAGGIAARDGSELWFDESEIVANGGSCHLGYYGVGGVLAPVIHVSGCLFAGNGGGWLRPGALAAGSGEVRDCTFTGNWSGFKPECGGTAGAVEGHHLLIERCRFAGNGGVVEAASLLLGGTSTVRDCEFLDHEVYVGYAGSVVTLASGAITVERCRFANTRSYNPVPILHVAAAVVSITECTFTDASERPDGSIKITKGEAEITWSLFARNASDYLSAGIVSIQSDVAIANCTFADLEASGGVALDVDRYTTATLHRSIVAGTRGGPALRCEKGTTITSDCNDLWSNENPPSGCPPGPSDFEADPLFCDRLNGDYSLLVLSPCAPPQSPPECDLIGAFRVGCGNVSVGPGSEEPRVRGKGRGLLLVADPNPMPGHGEIRFEIEKDADVLLAITDPAGRRVRTIAAGRHAAGPHAVLWDGRDEGDRLAPAGVYFLRLEARGHVTTGKLLLFR